MTSADEAPADRPEAVADHETSAAAGAGPSVETPDPAVTEPLRDLPGARVVRADLVGTALFCVSGVLASVVHALRWPFAVLSIALFVIGIAGFAWSFLVAAGRSREHEIGVANLYLLTGPTAPPPVKRAMNLSLTAQTVACIAFGAIGFSGMTASEVNPMACGILVPTLGFGLNGVWAARHGTFGPRIVTAAPTSRRRTAGHETPQTTPQGSEMEQNDRHD
ncbi:MAG: hypothetical protein R2705_20630 [Ilumatobacteraceae bacterium]